MKKKQSQNSHSLEELIERGSGLLFSGQAELALPFLQRAKGLSPKNTEVLDLIGEAYVDLGDYQKARRAFENSVEIAPEEAGTKWMFLGQMSTGTDALRYYEKGCEILSRDEQNVSRDRNLARACIAIAELYLTDLCMEADAEQRCENYVSKAEQFDSTSLEVLQTKASMRLSQHRNDEASEALNIVANRLLQIPFEDRDVPFEFCVQTCRLLVEINNTSLAIQLLESLLREDDENVEVWILLGHCHSEASVDAAQECFERAEELLENFIQADPSDELFRAQLEHVHEAMQNLDSKDKMETD